MYSQNNTLHETITDEIFTITVNTKNVNVISGKQIFSEKTFTVWDTNGKTIFTKKKDFLLMGDYLQSKKLAVLITEGFEALHGQSRSDSIFVIDVATGMTLNTYVSNSNNYSISDDEHYILTNGVAQDRYSQLEIIEINTGKVIRPQIDANWYNASWFNSDTIIVAIYRSELIINNDEPIEIRNIVNKKNDIEIKIMARHKYLNITEKDITIIRNDSIIKLYNQQIELLLKQKRMIEDNSYNTIDFRKAGRLVLYSIRDHKIINEIEMYSQNNKPILLSGAQGGFNIFKPTGNYFYIYNDNSLFKYDNKLNLVWEKPNVINVHQIQVLDEYLVQLGSAGDSRIKIISDDDTSRFINPDEIVSSSKIVLENIDRSNLNTCTIKSGFNKIGFDQNHKTITFQLQ
ncbi:MAG: hypothetical protein ACYC09_03205 [Bacteroidota bacterium]